jgi:hypothetical protein
MKVFFFFYFFSEHMPTIERPRKAGLGGIDIHPVLLQWLILLLASHLQVLCDRL